MDRMAAVKHLKMIVAVLEDESVGTEEAKNLCCRALLNVLVALAAYVD